MKFLQRIGYGWLLLSESFFGILSQHSNLVKVAAVICALFLALLHVPILAFAAWSELVPGTPTFSVILTVFYIVCAVLYTYFAAYLQNKRLTLRAAFAALLPKLDTLLMWIVLASIISLLFKRFGMAFSWWQILTQPETIITKNNSGSILVLLLWDWLLFFVVTSIALSHTGIIMALRRSVMLALRKTPELIGFLLLNVTVGIVPLGLTQFILSNSNYALQVPLFFKVLILYCIALFFSILYLAQALFTVALYLSSTGRPVYGFSSYLEKYFVKQVQQNNRPAL